MFERYTEKARRTIFFALHEACNFGSPFIVTEHLLLGPLNDGFLASFAPEGVSAQDSGRHSGDIALSRSSIFRQWLPVRIS